MTAKPKTIPCQRILFILPDQPEQVTAAVPAMAALCQAYPDAHFAGFIKQAVRGSVEGVAGLDGVSWLSDEHEIGGSFDTAVIFALSYKAASLARKAGIAHRVGYESSRRSRLLTDRLVPIPGVACDGSEGCLALARYLGASLTHEPELAS